MVEDNEVQEELSPLDETSERPDKDTQQRLPQYKYRSSHPPELMLTDPQSGMQTRSTFLNNNFFVFNAFLCQREPKNIEKALKEADWVSAM